MDKGAFRTEFSDVFLSHIDDWIYLEGPCDLDKLGKKAGELTVAIFPEGTRTLDGKFQRFRKGLILLLNNSDIDILPVTLNRFYSLKPKNRFYIDPFIPIEAVIHKPVEKKSLENKSDNEILAMLKSIVESKYVS